MHDGGVLGVAGLDEHAARTIAAAGAARDLHQELEGALGRAEIGHRERGVGVDDADQRDPREDRALW